jgi:hypothetical protein
LWHAAGNGEGQKSKKQTQQLHTDIFHAAKVAFPRCKPAQKVLNEKNVVLVEYPHT